MRRGRAWIAALAPQVALVAWIVFAEERGRAAGTEVLLEVRAVDPMDLFSGRYILVPLAIERIDLTRVRRGAGIEPAYRGPVYVRLREGSPFWEPVEVLASEPSADSGPFLLGELVAWDSERSVRFRFDVDRYYVPEDASDPTRRESERPAAREIAVVARVTAAGRAHVVDLRVDGVPFAEWNARQGRRGTRD